MKGAGGKTKRVRTKRRPRPRKSPNVREDVKRRKTKRAPVRKGNKQASQLRKTPPRRRFKK